MLMTEQQEELERKLRDLLVRKIPVENIMEQYRKSSS